MKKHFKHSFMLVIIFTTLLLFYNCKKDEGVVNNPPATPANPSPANNEDSVSLTPNLSWSVCTDPENDSVKYDVYLGKSNPPALVSSNILQNSYTPNTLTALTKYYWKLVAKDNKNNAASSPVWNFTTEETPPGDLEVFFCDATGTNYFGGADVFVYQSFSERENDSQRTNYYRKALTNNSNPSSIGANFYALPYQQYFIFCRWTNGTLKYTGEGLCFVPKGTKTKLVVHIF